MIRTEQIATIIKYKLLSSAWRDATVEIGEYGYGAPALWLHLKRLIPLSDILRSNDDSKVVGAIASVLHEITEPPNFKLGRFRKFQRYAA